MHALRNAVAGDAITLHASGWVDGNWVNWPASGGYTLFQSDTPLADGQVITIDLNDNTLSGVPLDVVGGAGSFTFGDGALGAAGNGFRVGVSGDGSATLENVDLAASALVVGSSSTSARLSLTSGSSAAVGGAVAVTGPGNALSLDASSLSAGGIAISGAGAELSLAGASTLSSSGALTVGDGAKFNSASSSAAITAGGLVVSGVAARESELNPGTYYFDLTEFDGSGSLTINGDIAVRDGGKVDLSGFDVTPYAVSAGRSIEVEGVFSHSKGGRSEGSQLIWDGSDLAVDGGTVKIADGGEMSSVGSVTVGGGSVVSVDGAVDDADSGLKYRSTLKAGGDLVLGGASGAGTLEVKSGALVDGIADIALGDGGAGTLAISGTHAATGYNSSVAATGDVAVGGSAAGTVTILDGGNLTAAGTGRLGSGAGLATVEVGGVGTGDKRSTLSFGDGLVADNAALSVKGGALLNVTGDAILGDQAGKTTTLTLNGRGGTGSGYNASFRTTGDLIVGNEGSAEIIIGRGGNITSGGSSILGKESGSKVTVSINDNDGTQGHYAWVAGGTAVVPGDYEAPEGDAALKVANGRLRVEGYFAMAGRDAGYADDYGRAIFTTGGELNMAGGSFYNMDSTGAVGKTEILSGGIVSGSGKIYAGEQFLVDGGAIAAGSRWMYDYNRNDATNSLTSLGHLHIYDHDGVDTTFHGTTYRTELDRFDVQSGNLDDLADNLTGKADRVTVYGDLEMDANFKVDISRALDGKYLLIDASGTGNAISGFTARSLNALDASSLLLSLNGKLLKGNNRIDRAGGLFTTIEGGDTKIYLTVDTTSNGNVVTYWTGASGSTWDMRATNFDARTAVGGGDRAFVGDNQFLDGDIVVFDYNAVAAANRTVNVTTNDADYGGNWNTANVVVAEVRVLGGSESDTFVWDGGSIFAFDSALYTTLDKVGNAATPSGQFVKIGNGTLNIHNANEFYGGIHLGEAGGAGGGTIVLYNDKGLGTYDSTSGFQQKGLVTVHENSTIKIADSLADFTINNRFIVESGKILTFVFPGDFTIADNNALADTVNNGKGGGVFIGNQGQIVYTGSGKLHLNDNLAKAGGGIYTELGYTLQVPAYIEGNYASGKGGGVFAERFFQLKDSSNISGNAAQGAGGGIYVGNVGTISGAGDNEFIVHGNTTILNNKSGGQTGGGIHVDAGRDLVVRTGHETGGGETFVGGDVWFEGNYAKVGFDQDDPAGGALDMENAIRNSVHLSRTASGGSGSPATLSVSGPYNTYFYDALSGDSGTEILISGVLATSDTARGPGTEGLANSAADQAMIDRGQKGAVIFHADSAFYGDTTVENGATFRLENYQDLVEGVLQSVETTYGRKGSLAAVAPAENAFALNADSAITGQGTIAADAIQLDGYVDLDDGVFDRPDARDGGGYVKDTTTNQGVLNLDGAVELAATAHWNLNLTNNGTLTAPKSDLIAVTGTAAFGGAVSGEKLTLDIDELVRGKYAVMTASGGISGYNTAKKSSDAEVFLQKAGYYALNLAANQAATAASDGIYSRLKVASYVESGALYLDVAGRNRHVTASTGGNWGYKSDWQFTAGYDAENVDGSAAWSKNDGGPATSTYIDGDMVTLTGGTYDLTTDVRPVDLRVTGAADVAITGTKGITTYAVAGAGAYGPNGTTITTVAANNDYGIEGYTGKLHKSGANTLTFSNTGPNTFTEGVEFNVSGGDAGVVSFNSADQLVVGADRTIDFLESGGLRYSGGTEEALRTLAADAPGTGIRIAAGKTATFDVSNAAGTLTLSGVVADLAANGAVAKTGAGTLKLSGANTFTGGATLGGGTIEIANDRALGRYTTVDGASGRVAVSGAGVKTILVDGAYTVKNRFVVDALNATNALTVNVASGALTIDNSGVATTHNGGAISNASAAQLTFAGSGTLAIRNNKTTAGSGGGIYTSSVDDLAFGLATTLGGNAAAIDGGGLYAAGDVAFNQAATIQGNTAGDSGGGVYADGAVTFSSTAGISGNAAAGGDGGAVRAKSITLAGPATISDNTASGRGGAFYIEDAADSANAGALSLTTGTAGNIVFSGNAASADGGEAAYVGKHGNIVVDASMSGSQVRHVQFDDTLVTDATTDHTLTKTGLGMLAFTGSGNVNAFRGTTNVEAGTFRVTTGTTYGGGGAFNLAGTGVNNIQITGGGSLAADAFHIRGVLAPDGATTLTVADADRIGTLTLAGYVNLYGDADPLSYQLDMNLDGVAGRNVYDQGDADLVVVDGTLNVVTNGNANKVVVNLRNYTEGKYLLASATQLLVDGADGVVNGIGQAGAFDVTIHDFLKTDRHRISFLRGDEKINALDAAYVSGNADATAAHNELWLATQYNNLYMYWTGTNATDAGAADVWQGADNELNGNWIDVKPDGSSSAETHFENFDSVAFVDSFAYSPGGVSTTVSPTNKTIKLGSNVAVTDMLVDTAGAYSFSGAGYGIATSGIYSGEILDERYSGGSGSADVPQTLTKRGSGVLAFTNTGTNKFEEGIDLEGGTIRFNSGSQLTVGAGSRIGVKDHGTLDYNGAADGTLATAIDIATGRTLTYNVANDVTHTASGQIAGNALTKTGAGRLTLSNILNAYAGATTVSAGTLRAVGDGNSTALGENAVGTTHSVTLAAGTELELEVAAGDTATLNQRIAGTGGSVEKVGDGEQILSHADNAYTGGTTVTGGTLTAKHAYVGAGAVGSIGTGNVLIDGTNSVLRFAVEESGSFAGAIGGSGKLEKTTAGTTLTLNNAAASTFSGGTAISGGTGAAAESRLVAKRVDSVGGGAVTISGQYDVFELDISSDGTFDNAMSGVGRFVKSGSGVATIGGSNSFTGGTTLAGGGLILSGASALGGYNSGISSSGRVAVTGTNTSTTLAAGGGTFANHFDVGAGLSWTLNATSAGTLGGFTNGGDGGAVSLGAGSTMTLANSSAITFSGNADGAGANDIHMASGSTLDIAGTGNAFFGGGIRGTGTVTKAATSTGLTQIGADSSIAGSTTVGGGRFRIDSGAAYASTGAGSEFDLAAGRLEGNGTVSAGVVTVTGTISPDSDSLSAAKSAVGAGGERIGVLTLSGTTIKLGDDAETFAMDYDLGLGNTGDLLKTVGATTLYGGTINFIGALDTGRYLIIDSNSTIALTAGKTLDGINDTANGVLEATLNGKALNNNTPRYGLAYLFGDEGGDDVDSEVWLDVERNTLAMNWTNAGATATWDISSPNWRSAQWDATHYATEFNNGDYVNFAGNNASGQTIAVAADVVVSGMTFSGNNDIAFTGDGGILSRLANGASDTEITGKFVDAGNTTYVPNVVPDAMLQKSGSGVLTFANGTATKGNTFNKGIAFNASAGDAGVIAFNRANQLGDGGHGVAFNDNGALRADAAIASLTNDLHIADGKTATFDTNGFDVVHTGKIDEIGGIGAGNFAKTGAGVLTLNNAANAWSGATTVSGGTLRAVGVGSLGDNLAAKSVNLAAASTKLAVQVAVGGETLNKRIFGTGGFEKLGGGELILSHADNAYTGGTTVAGGTLTAKHAYVGAGAAGSIGTGNVLIDGTNSVLRFAVEESGSFAGAIGGSGKLEKTTAGTTLTLNNAAASTFSGGTTISGGTGAAAESRLVAKRVDSVGGGAVTISGQYDVFELDISSDGTFDNAMSGVGRFVKSGSGVATIGGSNSFTGGTTLAGGGLILSGASALGGYNSGISSSGRVAVTGTNTSTTLAAGGGTFANHFDVGAGLFWTLNATSAGTLGGFTTGGDGGAVSLGAGSTMTLANSSTITFSNNADGAGANDIHMAAGSTLAITGTGNAFINSGIAGTGTVTKAAGSGVTQIAANSAFDGTTTVSGGVFRVAAGVSYGVDDSGAFTLAGGATLAGGGTIKADSIVIGGTISADSKTMTAIDAAAPTGAASYATLTLDGGATLASTFRMDYDAKVPNNSNSPTGDLLAVVNGTLAVDGGTINLRNDGSQLSGSYHIVDADRAITVGGDINDVLTATINGNALDTISIRGGYQFAMKASNTEIWLDVFRNSLNMAWNDSPENTVWTATSGGRNWTSKQGGASPLQPKEAVFSNGDYVHFTGSGGQSIAIDGKVIVAGFEFDSSGDYAFTGTGGILSDDDHSSTEGQFVGVDLIPDGKLNKSGDGVLSFRNTGGNRFTKGVEINAGTIAFTRADQLGTLDTDDATDNGIAFKGTGTLRADADGEDLDNRISVEAGRTANIFTQAHTLTLSGKIVGAGALAKSTGTATGGTLILTNTGNEYAGDTTVATGTLRATSDASGTALGENAAGTAHKVNLAGDAELELEVATGVAATLNQRIAQSSGAGGKVEKIEGGEQVLAHADNTYTGGTTVTAGTLTGRYAAHDANAGSFGSGRIVNNAALKYDMHAAGTAANQLAGAGTFTKTQTGGPFDLTLDNVANAFSGDVTVTGGTNVNANRLVVVDSRSLGDAASTTRTITLATAYDILRIDENAQDGALANRITGAGALEKHGARTTTLSNANDFAGGTRWSGGGIHLAHAKGLSATGGAAGSAAGFVYVNADGTLTTAAAVDTIQNRFEVDDGKTLAIGNALAISGNAVDGVDGGAIALGSGASFASASSIALTDNSTTGDGGAIYAPTEHVVVGGTGTNAVAELAGNEAGGDGGGVYAKSVSVKGRSGGTTVSGNTAGGRGGAIYLVGGTLGSNAVSTIDSAAGSIKFENNTASGLSNAIHMNEYVTLDITGAHVAGEDRGVRLLDGISSKAGAANGNVVNIDMPSIAGDPGLDMRDSALYLGGASDYYGDTEFNGGLMVLRDGSRFGAIGADNAFTQYSGATVSGSGTISAKEILLGGCISAGTYSPPPRAADIDTLSFVGSTAIGALAGVGQTALHVDIDVNAALQTADLMDVTGSLKIDGASAVDFDAFSAGKFLIARTTDGVSGHTVDMGNTYQGETIITDFISTIAGLALNPGRFEIVYTLENGGTEIYANLKLNNNYNIWTGANAYSAYDSDQWAFHSPQNNPDADYNNDWLNSPLYNWHQVDDAKGTDFITRFRQGDRVAFVGNDSTEIAQAGYLDTRKNIEIATLATDDDRSGQPVDSPARVADMIVTNGGTYRFTGRGIEASVDAANNIAVPLENAGGQLYVTSNATAIFANAANNFQRGVVLQNGSVAFNSADQLGTLFVGDTYNGGVTASHGIKVEGDNSYGVLIANADDMELGIVINIDKADSQMVVDTGGNDFGDASVTGDYTLTLKHAAIAGHTDPELGTPTEVNGIYGLGQLVKRGTGTLVLAESNAYEGGTAVEKGTLAVAADNRLGKAGTSVLLDGGALRALDTFSSDRAVVLSENGGAVDVDSGKDFTLNGPIVDLDVSAGVGDFRKTGEGRLILANTSSDYAGDTIVEKGRLTAVGVATLGENTASREIEVADGAELEMRTAGDERLLQGIGGEGDVFKTGAGKLELAGDLTGFLGTLVAEAGILRVTGDINHSVTFRVEDGATLCGNGRLSSSAAAGLIKAGGILAPGNVVADDPNVDPISSSLTIDGDLSFVAGSRYQVVITQYADAGFDPSNPDRMRPVSDCVVVENGGIVAIAPGSLLEVAIDYWADNLTAADFGESTSGYFTIIDAEADTCVADPDTLFTLLETELPRGVELLHGWNGALYQLWFEGDPMSPIFDLGLSHNEFEAGKDLADLVAGKDPGMKELNQILGQKEITDDMLADIYRQLAGDIRANSVAMALKKPWRRPFNRLNSDLSAERRRPLDEQIDCMASIGRKHVWGEAYGRYGDLRGDGNSYGHDAKRSGFVVGYQHGFSDQVALGLSFNHSEAELKQKTGKVELRDYEFGVYGLARVHDLFDLKAYLGYAHLDYDIKRTVDIPAGGKYPALHDAFKNGVNGASLSFSAEASRAFAASRNVSVSPVLAFDLEHVRQKGYRERGGLTALTFGRSDYKYSALRAGINVDVALPGRFELNARAQYERELGRGYARSAQRFAGATVPTAGMDVRSLERGRDNVNLGVGGMYFLNDCGKAALYANYDVDVKRREISHTGNFGIVVKW